MEDLIYENKRVNTVNSTNAKKKKNDKNKKRKHRKSEKAKLKNVIIFYNFFIMNELFALILFVHFMTNC